MASVGAAIGRKRIKRRRGLSFVAPASVVTESQKYPCRTGSFYRDISEIHYMVQQMTVRDGV